MSGRNLEQRVGLAPKTLARVVRFQRALWVPERPGVQWAETAAACGYYHQAHLARDFREFTGRMPSEHRQCAPEISRAAQGHRNPKLVGFYNTFPAKETMLVSAASKAPPRLHDTF
jgi:AraC-like DNA-binding protein